MGHSVKMDVTFVQIVIFSIVGHVLSTSEPNIYAPVIVSSETNSRDIPLFRGKIREDETTVRLEPALAAYDNDTVGSARLICRYEIVTNRKNIPFVIELKNRETGEAELKLKEGAKLNYEKRKHYKFNIFAYDCVDPPYDRRSNRAVVLVKVEDSDKYAPVFPQKYYSANMEEKKLYENIIQVTATDSDESEEFKGICGYDIESNEEIPFVIDKNGVLKNTKVVSHEERYNFILKVVARDCGGMVSEPAFININVTEACRNGWKDFPDHVQYTPMMGHRSLAESAHLQICDDSCKPDHISVRLELATKHIGKGCDRDTYSITSQRKLCGGSTDSVDLLPMPTLTSNWTNAIPTDDGHDGDKIYAFDGITNAVEVPDDHVNHKIGKHFTISTWMKHTFPNTVVTTHKNGNKEHIVCMADGDGMNRRHYALFIHNTKLIFVLRQEGENGKDLEVFQPAEWRWELDQINDGEWHHYAISMDFPEVRLYVDGALVEVDEDNFDILDDWPLHPTDRVHFTKLVVGACWRGLEEKYVDHFQGYLASLSLLKDKTESERVIQCLNNCQENLELVNLGEMASGTSVSFNKDQTEYSFTGSNASDIEKLVQQLTYINYRTFPTPGRRNLNVKTSVHCGTTEEILPTVDSFIFVEHSNKPVITIAGHNVVTGNKEALEKGMPVFKDVSIHVDFYVPTNEVEGGEDEEEIMDNETTDLKKPHTQYKLGKATLMQDTMVKKDNSDVLLDMCSMRAEPVLNFYVEHLDMPKDLIEQFNMKLEGIETAAGLVILNADTVANYMKVIQHIGYTHTQAEDLYMRKFIISCSSQSERFVSNEFEIMIAQERMDEPKMILRAHAQNNLHSQDMAVPHFQQIHAASPTNFGMVAIIVVCVGFLIFMIVLGVLRIRAAHYRRPRTVQVDERQEMEWDNSELNITVNPIDQELFEYEENPRKGQILADDSDTDDDVSECFQDDDADFSEEEEERLPGGKMEWDDSAY